MRLSRAPAVALLVLSSFFLMAPGEPVWVDEMPWVQIVSPEAPGRVGGTVPLVEVRGRAGLGSRAPIDVVLVFDLSESTLYPSGMDVDRDGQIGKLSAQGVRNAFGTLRPSRRWTTDPGDTIVAAEIEAARRLLQRLEVAHTRVGLVRFAGRASEVFAVGEVDGALRALDEIRPRLDPSGTNLGSAVRAAIHLLERSARLHGRGRKRVVILLTDGYPTVPAPAIHARSYALAAAERARELGIELHGYALGSDHEHGDVLREMAELTEGTFRNVQRVAEVVDQLPYAEFGGIDRVVLRNRTAALEGRAVRVFADGSFDGFVPLIEGDNLLEVTVHTRAGATVETLRSVSYDAAESPLRAPAEWEALLRARTFETELAARMRRRDAERERNVRVAVHD